jgi:hypothetical protein
MTKAEAISKADRLVEQAADRLQELAQQAAAEGGFKAKLAEPLGEDAAFVRQLKPSLIEARIRGEAPTNRPPGEGTTVVTPRPESARPPKERGEGPNPFVVIGVAFAAGIMLAKLIDWRGHAHPRD